MSVAALLLLAQVASVAALGATPGVSIDWYDVTGGDADAVRAAIDRVRPRDPNDGLGYDARTDFAVSWRWPVDGGGRCTLDRVALTIRARVAMPRLVGPVAPALRARWDRYADALAAHEGRHVARVFARTGEVVAAIRAATCDAANVAGNAALERIKADEIAYDIASDHGRSEGARFP